MSSAQLLTGQLGYRLLALSPFHSLHPHPVFPQKVFSVSQSHPQRLSLLEVVLDEESVSMVLRRMSPATGSSGDLGDSVVALIQGWSQICSRVGLSDGRRARHHLISCWHSEGVEEETENNIEDALTSKGDHRLILCVTQFVWIYKRRRAHILLLELAF